MIKSQITILQQAQHYLMGVSEQQYCEIISPLFMSSAGAHIRHILDHYHAMIVGMKSGVIDYDQRTRGGSVESEPHAALQAIDKIIMFLNGLSEQALQQTVKLSTEVSVTNKQVMIAETTLAREVIFVGSHAVHHLATIKHIALTQKIDVAEELGIAPATATFLRAG